MSGGLAPGGAMKTGGRILVDCLKAHGADTIFGVPGESFLAILDALYDTPEIRFICSRHEGAASNMAEADGKLTGRPGLCMVTRGPGATHAAAGVHTAAQDSTPMILFIGQVPRASRGRDSWQEIDYEKMFGSMAKWAIQIDDPERIPEIIARAYAVATSGRPGPVVIALPEDVLSEVCASSGAPEVEASRIGDAAPSPQALEALRDELRSAKRPLVMVGGSNWTAQDRANLATFIEAWGLPVVASFRRQDIFDNRHENYAGHMGLGLNPKLAARIKEADLLVAVGCRISDTATAGYTLFSAPRMQQRLIHVHADAAELGRVYHPDLGINASIANISSALAELTPPAQAIWEDWRKAAREDFIQFTRPGEGSNRPGVDLGQVVGHLSETLPGDAMVSNGAGNYTVWLHRYFQYGGGRTELAPVSGAMGYGLPAAIAAKARHPDRTVVCFAGDGCFMMYPQELSTAVQIGAAVIVLISNNGMYGTIRMHQEREHPGRVIGTDLNQTDFVALAQSLGAYAERVTVTAEFPEAFRRAQASGRPAVLELQVDRLQITPTSRLADA